MTGQSLSLTSELPLKAKYVLLGILFLALSLRLWGIAFGLPYDFTPDEVHEIIRALKLGAGEYEWDGGKGGLYLLLFVEYGFLFVFWWLTGYIDSPADFAIAYVQNPTAFYLLGRLTVAIMGAATCYIVYLLGRSAHGWRVGIVAAFIGATAYFHGMWSHYVNVDIGMTLALWASVLAYAQYESTGQPRWLIGAGVLGGTAIAFKLPGAVVIVPIILAIASPRERWNRPREILKQAGAFMFSLLLTVAVLAPGLFLNIGSTLYHFSYLFDSSLGEAGFEDIDEIDFNAYFTLTARGGGYFNVLTNEQNLFLTLSAIVGAAIGVWRKNRRDTILTITVITFLSVMLAADRPGNERYLLPIVPALWLLTARAILAVAGGRKTVASVLIAIVIAVPFFKLVRQDYTWTLPDTRVLAKYWIEENVPDGSKILMDGMEYRFIQSPPLNPDKGTVTRRLSRASEEGGSLSRGISDSTLSLYEEAMEGVEGPRYELHSTVWGVDVEDLSYYPRACFDYIITSSDVSQRYEDVQAAEEFPHSARFYRELPDDPRFDLAYVAKPEPWRIQGPEISVYRVQHSCPSGG